MMPTLTTLAPSRPGSDDRRTVPPGYRRGGTV